MTPRPRALFFDFFGTLVRYSPSRTEQGFPATHAYLQGLGATVDYDAFLGEWSTASAILDRWRERTDREFSMHDAALGLFDRLGLTPEPDALDGFGARYLAEWSAGVRPFEGVAAMLRCLHQAYPMALVTNTHHAPLVHGHLNGMGIADCFAAVITSIEHGRPKPHPSIFEAAARALGVPLADCLHIGDDPLADVLGATAAGARALLVDPEGRHGVEAVGEEVIRVGSVLRLSEML